MKMDSKYLIHSPLDWLLEDSDPSIRYLTSKEILEDPACDSLYEAIADTPAIRKLVDRKGILLGRSSHDDIFYRGIVWCFAEAIERGLDKRSSIIQNSAEFIIARHQTQSGGFSLQWKPLTELACRTGDMLRLLLRAGFKDERIHRGIEWIAAHQRHDGGWLHCPLAGSCDQLRLILLNKPGSGLNREHDLSVTSCIYATIACSMALVDYRDITGSIQYDATISTAADFFLKRSLYKTSRGKPIQPRPSWNHDFRLLGYPVMSQYDILLGTLFIAKAGLLSDRRAGESFNLVISKQNNDGSWNMENAQTGMMFGNESKRHVGKKSKWVTLQAMRLLTLFDKNIKNNNE